MVGLVRPIVVKKTSEGPPKWERLVPGVYRWLGQNSTGTILAWVERGCDTNAAYRHWYWHVFELDSDQPEMVGYELSLKEAKDSAMEALDQLFNR